MQFHRQLATATAVTLLFASGSPAVQEPVGKRLSAIVGVAVEEYGKGVDASGRLISAMEHDEATGFLREAKEVATRLATANAAAVRIALDSLSAAAERKAKPADVDRFYRAFSTALGAEGALDMPTRPIDLARGRATYQSTCASCHGANGGGGTAAQVAKVAKGTPPPPAIGQRDIMHDVTPALTYRIVSVGVQGTAMPAFAGTLSTDDRWDVVAYVNALRSSPADRERGKAVLARICATCATTPALAQSFTWQAQRSDAQLVTMLRAGDPETGLPAAAPLTASEADALVAVLRETAVVEPIAAQASVEANADRDPRIAARAVLRILDDAIVAAKAGRQTDATDLAFDAYIAFEPLETNARMRNASLVARLEREFADFHSAVKAGDLRAAETHRSTIELELPSVLELTAPADSPWAGFVEAFLIILREGFEAILVLGAVVAFLIKTGHRERVREIWIGAGAGLVASIVLAILLRTVLAAMPASREVIEGVTMLVAVVVLFSVSYWLLSKVESARWQQFIRERVNTALSHGGSFALAFVAFLAVFREGAETALFFQALIARTPGTLVPMVAGIGAGGVTLAVVFSLFYRFGVRIPLRPFFAVTSGLLYWMALVFAGKGIKELQEGGAMSRTLVPGFPHIDALGLYPTVETILAQTVLVGLLLFALWRTLRRVETLEKEVEHDPTIHRDRRPS